MTADKDDKSTRSVSLRERFAALLGNEPQDQEALLDILKGASDRHIIDADTIRMIEGIFQITDSRVRDIALPRSKIVFVEQDGSQQAVLFTITSSGHSRFPVVGEKPDQVVGILLAKDLLHQLSQNKPFDIKSLLRPVFFVPDSKNLNILLQEFRSHRQHMAIVIDEYGSVDGLVTIEDVIERIVGSIRDEHDVEALPLLNKQGEDDYMVDAIIPLEQLAQYGILPPQDDEDIDTLGGLVMKQLGYVPKLGERMRIGDWELLVEAADERRIHKLRMHKTNSST